jgi:bacterioferritin-associated ferredoxin
VKHWLFLLASSVLLTSCSSRPLSETECQLIRDKEIQYAVASFPPEDAESLREHLLANADSGAKQCTTGATYRRSDYKCMLKASDRESIGKCISTVNKRLGH